MTEEPKVPEAPSPVKPPRPSWGELPALFLEAVLGLPRRVQYLLALGLLGGAGRLSGLDEAILDYLFKYDPTPVEALERPAPRPKADALRAERADMEAIGR